jgi:hypothetical protein
LIHRTGRYRVPSQPFEPTPSPEHAEPVHKIGRACPVPKPSAKTPMRAVVRIQANLPVTQVEIDVIASLIDDWESLFPIATEAAE